MRAGNRDAARARMMQGPGTVLMDRIRAIRSRIITRQLALIQERRDQSDANSFDTRLTLLLGCLAFVALLFLNTRKATHKLGRPVHALIGRMHALTIAAGSLRQCHLALVPERDAAGTVIGLFAIHTDITQSKRLERELKFARDQYQSLYEATPAMLHSVDAQGRLLTVSDVWPQKTRLPARRGHRQALGRFPGPRVAGPVARCRAAGTL